MMSRDCTNKNFLDLPDHILSSSVGMATGGATYNVPVLLTPEFCEFLHFPYCYKVPCSCH